MRAPTYTPRERLAISIADRVVLRLYTQEHGWTQTEVRPTQMETLADCLRRVQDHLQCMSIIHPALQRACLYVAGEIGHETHMASVPRDMVPPEVEHPLADYQYPTPTPARSRTS
jgi:hypothetical protein